MSTYLDRHNISHLELYEAIRNDILTLVYKPGQLLSESVITSRFQVSRTPVRTVFTRLAEDNLLEIRPQRGSFVSLLDLDYIKDIVYMRTLVEADVLRHAALAASPVLMDALESNLAAQRQVIDLGQPLVTFNRLDSDFHALSFAAAGRQRLWSVLQASEAHYQRFRHLDIVSDNLLESLYQEHAALCRLLGEQNLTRLTDAITSHLQGGIRRLESHILTEHPEYFQSRAPAARHSDASNEPTRKPE